MSRKKAILLAVAGVAIAAAVRHCRKIMASSAKGAPIGLCARVGARACGPKERAEEAGSETAALAA